MGRDGGDDSDAGRNGAEDTDAARRMSVTSAEVSSFICSVFRAPIHAYFKALLLECLVNVNCHPKALLCPGEDEVVAIASLVTGFCGNVTRVRFVSCVLARLPLHV
jgi:hypothetical protein